MASFPASDTWTLVATLRHHPGRPTRVDVADPDAHINVEAWSRSEGWCERCRTRRRRRTTFLVRDRTGGLTQVGANCLAELVGGRHPLEGLSGGLRVRSPRRTHHERRIESVEYVGTVDYLSHVAQLTLDSGFVPTTSASRTNPATWSSALAALDNGRAPSRRALRRAQETLGWARHQLHAEDKFERRLFQVLSHERLTRRELPTAAAGVYAYHQQLRRVIAARKAGHSMERPAGG